MKEIKTLKGKIPVSIPGAYNQADDTIRPVFKKVQIVGQATLKVMII